MLKDLGCPATTSVFLIWCDYSPLFSREITEVAYSRQTSAILASYDECSLGRVQFSEGWVVYTAPLPPWYLPVQYIWTFPRLRSPYETNMAADWGNLSNLSEKQLFFQGMATTTPSILVLLSCPRVIQNYLIMIRIRGLAAWNNLEGKAEPGSQVTRIRVCRITLIK